MILIDYTQIAIGSLMVALNRSKEKEADIDLVRHLILNGGSKIVATCHHEVLCSRPTVPDMDRGPASAYSL